MTFAPLPGLPFTGPNLLAPMEGVTEPCFRDLVLALHTPENLGGAYTEFVRVVDRAYSIEFLQGHLGTERHPMPVGLQIMGADLDAVRETARRAVEAGAALVDLNFGCPSKGALRGCAGSSLLDRPRDLETLVRVAKQGVEDALPLTAKIRAGGDDDSRLEELCRAAENGGAQLITVHCRTRKEAYRDCEDWKRLERAVASVKVPICGNGGVWQHADLARLRRETGCALAMVGRAALADPWIFSGVRVDASRAARFLADYAERLTASGRNPTSVAGRLKQLLVTWIAGDLVGDDRPSWLREKDPEALVERVQQAAEGRLVNPASAC
ncbi:MAG: tRNA-dihydrouridine synthase family protein [Planctomycetota bacterium]